MTTTMETTHTNGDDDGQEHYTTLISIHVGTDIGTEALYIQQGLLEDTSEYFVNAIKYAEWGANGQRGVLRFPEDDYEVWEVFVRWASYGEVAGITLTTDDMLATKCHIMGDKYDIPQFQDEAMLALLVSTSRDVFSWPRAEVYNEVAVNTPLNDTPLNAVLRTSMAELVIRQFESDEDVSCLPKPYVDELGLLGFTTDLLRAQAMQHKWHDFEKRMMNEGDDLRARYEPYLLCGLDEEHKAVRWLKKHA
ncbi:hypothetical protein LTR85_005226 [Meristemomyces frigidus]|nr:hypothetical protein LTR85_005226 [Meristemomyces frigidus]